MLSRRLLATAVILLPACQASEPQPEHSLLAQESVAARSLSTNELRVLATAPTPRIRSPDSVLISYRVHNDGPAVLVRDFPEYYHFRVFGPEGLELHPVIEREQYGSHGRTAAALGTGASTPEHRVNLACMQYHALSFEVRDRARGTDDCMASFRFTRPGRYTVVVQHVPLAPPGANDPDPEFRPSRADTVYLDYRPK